MLSISYKTDSVDIVEGVIKTIENLRVSLKVWSFILLHDLLILLDEGVWGDWLFWCKLQFVFSLEQHEQCCHYRRMSVLYDQAANTLG